MTDPSPSNAPPGNDAPGRDASGAGESSETDLQKGKIPDERSQNERFQENASQEEKSHGGALHERASSRPAFWDERFERDDPPFGAGPSAFVMQHADVLAPGAEVLELGAGDGRTLRALAASHGIRGTAIDFSPAAVQRARDRARSGENGTVEAICADVRTWQPETTYDAVIVTFVQLLPAERRALFACMRSAVRPGGWVLGQWFRPAHLRGGYDRVGPNRPDRMVPLNELRAAFHDFDPLMVAGSAVTLDEGFLQGRAATAHLAARRPGA